MDETFAVFADADRRFVLRHLHRNGATTVTTLVNQLAAERNDTVPACVTTDQCRETAIRLHHVHVPKLTDANLIEEPGEDDLLEPTGYLSYVLATMPVDLSSGSWSSPGESAVLD